MEILTWEACAVVAWRLVEFTECMSGIMGLNRLGVWCYDPWGWHHRIANVHIKRIYLLEERPLVVMTCHWPKWHTEWQLNILTTTDAYGFLMWFSVRVWYTELTICLTVGIEHIIIYSFQFQYKANFPWEWPRCKCASCLWW